MSDKKDEFSFTWETLQKELDNYRKPLAFSELSDQQIDFIKKCRETKRPISFSEMSKLWAKLGWGEIRGNTLSAWYNRISNK